MPCTEFLVALRNPIDRIESWWYYETSLVQKNFSTPNMWYQKLKGCYDNFELFAEQGGLRSHVDGYDNFELVAEQGLRSHVDGFTTATNHGPNS